MYHYLNNNSALTGRGKMISRGDLARNNTRSQAGSNYGFSVTEVSSFSLQMGSFAIGTATSLIFMALLASGNAALGKYFLKLEAFAIKFRRC